MAQLKITALQGLRTHTYDEVDHVSGDLEQDQEEKDEEKKAWIDNETVDVGDEIAYDDDFDDVEDDEELEKSEFSNSTCEAFDSTSQNTSTEKLDEGYSQLNNRKPRKNSRNKKLKAGSNTKPPHLNLYQNQLRSHLTYSRQRSSSLNRDTMSDQEVGQRRGRKLQRRGQMKKCHSFEHSVEQAGRDRLEQKFVELEELMTRPLVDTRKVRTPSRQLQKMSKMHHHNPGTAQRRHNSRNTFGACINNTVHDEEDSTDRQAYSTIHKIQTAGPPHIPVIYNNQRSAPGSEATNQSSENSRLMTKPPIPRRRNDSVNSSSSGSSGAFQSVNDVNRQQQNGADHCVNEEDGEDARFGNVSPRSVYVPVDMHLKYSDNPKLQDWLKRKNAEHRQARKAERAKKREERHVKQTELELKAVRREKSSERVKQWMDLKHKEALKKQKEEKRRKKKQVQEEAAVKARTAENGIRGKQIDRPQSAPTSKKTYTPIRRPESAARLENGAYTAPKPPDSKFVYKRPVSGRVRLMKLQNEKNEKVRNADSKQLEELSAEEKEKKMRLSYDSWLVTKRKDDASKRKEAKRQQELMKSDPEMDRLIPEVANRRIEMIEKEKKAIDTGISQIDDDVNKRFGGGAFGGKENKKTNDDNDASKSFSYNLAIEGSAATLVELNTRARPTSAKTRMPIPQSAFSPRRSNFSKTQRDSSPKVRTIMDADHMSESNPFRLPFSDDDKGVPYHVRRVQEKSFSRELASQSNNSQRPEPQGCAAVESAICPKDVNAPKAGSFPKSMDETSKSVSTPRTSLVLLQQIEEAAVQSEQEAKRTMQTVPENTDEETATAAELELNPGTGEVGENVPSEGPDQPYDLSNNNGENLSHMKKDNEEETKTEDGTEHSSEKQQNAGEVITSSPSEKNEKSSPEDLLRYNDLTASSSVLSGDQHKPIIKHDEELGQPSEQLVSQKSASDDNEGNVKKPEGDDEERGVEGSLEETTPRRSIKRVSFCEDLTTVFEPTSAETSSNFEDERGADDKEPDSYMSLDDTPDPV